MSENIRGTEYWLMEEFFYQETDTPQIFIEESIIALGFDIKINLKKYSVWGKNQKSILMRIVMIKIL
ncbi:hypothetical protein ACK2FX_06250 [Clostridioides difficile]